MILTERRAIVGHRFRASLLFLSGFLALAACVPAGGMGERISYVPPASAVPGSMILTVPGDRNRALRTLSGNLRRAGFEIVEMDPAQGKLRAVSPRADLVDCGVLTQSARGAKAAFDGAAPLAAIFDSTAKGDVLRREVRVRTEVAIEVGQAGTDGRATGVLTQKQTVSLRKLSADGGTVLASQKLEAGPGQSMTFADGTVCKSSGRLVEAFR